MFRFPSLMQRTPLAPSLRLRWLSTSAPTAGVPDLKVASHGNVDKNIHDMSNEELADTSTIPGWEWIHSPPRKFPRGALIGTVVSDRMQKTVNVAVDRFRIVPKLRLRRRYTRKFMAHDEEEVGRIGDLVMITPCHRISKHKHFMLREILRPKDKL